MWNEPSMDLLKKLQIPKIYATDFIRSEDKLIFVHFFIGGCDWFIAEFDYEDSFYGYAILNCDLMNAEWGYILFSELREIKLKNGLEVEFDLHWEVKRANKISKIIFR
jgi:hypothetical protein